MALRQKFTSATYHLTARLPSLVRGTISRNAVNAYWYRDIKNFGDLVTPSLLRHFGFTPVHSYPSRARLVATGSILEHVQDAYAGFVVGSGLIDERSRPNLSRARVLSVRGKLTRERLADLHHSVPLGDPGLLAALLVPEREEKKYVLGLIPHHANKRPEFADRLLQRFPGEVTVIDVQQDPADVIREIDRCESIISSSLHGLIVADALRIPNAWLAEPRLLGGRFKFDDYYSSLDTCADPIHPPSGTESLKELVDLTRRQPIDSVVERQLETERTFRQALSLLRNGE